MKTQIDVENKLKELKTKLNEEFFVERIGYFGSYARNDQDEDSDIDILVYFSKAPGWDFFDLQDLLEEELNLKVDLVSEKALKKQLKQTILNNVKYI
jgi:uncharacterized protein